MKSSMHLNAPKAPKAEQPLKAATIAPQPAALGHQLLHLHGMVGNQAMQRMLAPPSLTVGEPGTAGEREAEHVAKQVAGGSPVLSIANDGGNGLSPHAPTSARGAIAESGTPLEPNLRSQMEDRFGHHFSLVRMHSGADAETSARDLGAKGTP